MNELVTHDAKSTAGAGMSASHPDLVALRDRLAREGPAPPDGTDIAGVRAYLRRLSDAVIGSSTALERESLISIQAAGRDVPCKLYLPDRSASFQLLLYCHGGGFRHGELESWDAPLRQLVRDSGVAILSIGYALAPERPFPQAFDEVGSIVRLVTEKGIGAEYDIRGFALGGDSAGANLALGAALSLRDIGSDALSYLLLIYGVYSMDLDSPSWSRFEAKGGHGLSRKSMAEYWSAYVPNGDDDWRVQPINADLSGLPSTRIVVGDLDPLLDENLALAEKMRSQDVKADLVVLKGIPHGVMRFNEAAAVVKGIVRSEGRALHAAFQASH